MRTFAFLLALAACVDGAEPEFPRPSAYFETNCGQHASPVRFLLRAEGYHAFLTSNEIVFVIHDVPPAPSEIDSATFIPSAFIQSNRTSRAVRMGLVGADPQSDVVGTDPLAGKVNYFIGNVPALWRTNVPTFRSVSRPQVYPGVDLVCRAGNRDLSYGFTVHPGADPAQIKWDFLGPDAVLPDLQTGGLRLALAGSELKMSPLSAWQHSPTGRVDISILYIVQDGIVSFELGPFNRDQPLQIE